MGRGEVELGIHQISEILPVKGVRLVGPLPAEFQRYTVYVARAAERQEGGQRSCFASHQPAGARAPHPGGIHFPAVSDAGKPVVLAVDDDTDLLALIGKVLSRDYKVLTAEDPGTALDHAVGKPRPDLILLDVEMPGASGFELCQVLKAEANVTDIPVIFLTGNSEPKSQVEGLEMGAVDYITKPINAAVLQVRVRNQMALANRRAELERLVKERTAALESTRLQLIRRLSRAMELHESASIGNRVMRLSQYARLIAHAAGAKPAVSEMLSIAAPLHDIGKLGVPSEILRKAGKLSAPDWERVKRHPEIGADIIGEHDDPLLKLARQLALTHHERWDGSGYPKGLKGDQIPWAGAADGGGRRLRGDDHHAVLARADEVHGGGQRDHGRRGQAL